jgi:hypothetical protein
LSNFTFKLNKEKWIGWQTELTGIDHSNYECNMTVIINAEDQQEAEQILGLVVNRTLFDLDSVEDTNDLMVYEIPGGCGSK